MRDALMHDRDRDRACACVCVCVCVISSQKDKGNSNSIVFTSLPQYYWCTQHIEGGHACMHTEPGPGPEGSQRGSCAINNGGSACANSAQLLGMQSGMLENQAGGQHLFFFFSFIFVSFF